MPKCLLDQNCEFLQKQYASSYDDDFDGDDVDDDDDDDDGDDDDDDDDDDYDDEYNDYENFDYHDEVVMIMIKNKYHGKCRIAD